jgi:hypothetical protein
MTFAPDYTDTRSAGEQLHTLRRLPPAAGPAVFTTLIHQCHGASFAAGWWTDIRTGEPITPNYGEKLMLVVSELSEAMEGYRKNLKDDKLPQRPMIEVELADAAIRLFDLMGHLKSRVDPLPGAWFLWPEGDEHRCASSNIAERLLDIAVTAGACRIRHSGQIVEGMLFVAVYKIVDLANDLNLDLGGAIAEKLEFNANRPDHKIENRLKNDGKKF